MTNMLPNTRKIAFFALLFCCSGCFDFTEEYFFNADKSGHYVMRVDMSRMMNFSGKMRENWERQRDSLLALGKPLQVDSSFAAFDRIPDSIRQLAKHPELLSRFKGRMILDYERQSGVIEFIIDFKDLDDLQLVKTEWKAFKQLTDSIQGKKEAPALDENVISGATPPDFIGSEMPEFLFDGKKFSMTYLIAPKGDESVREMMTDDSPFGRSLLKSFKYNLFIHLPKNIKSFEGEGFLRDGRTLGLRTNFYEIAMRKESGIRLKAKLK